MTPLFLFGSGVSPAPSVKELTEYILSADLHRCGDGIWRLRTSGGGCLIQKPADDPRYVRHLLQNIRVDIASDRGCVLDQVNYEDIANVCTQMNKNAGTGRNSALAPYIKELRRALRLTDEEVGYLAWASCDWISWAVYHAFKAVKDAPTSLHAFNDSVLSKTPSATIVTLNHDLHLEEVLGDGVNLGFSKQGNCAFHPDILAQPDGLKLLKLHGSIDWFWTKDDVLRRADLSFPAPDTPPLIIAGTISKLEDYNYGPFPWLWAEFQNALRQTRCIVISGYGFKDVGVNTRLTDWLRCYPDARILVLHPNPGNLRDETAKHPIDAVQRFFAKWRPADVGATTTPWPTDARVLFGQTNFAEAANAAWASHILDFLRPNASPSL